jgi:hypothetical protein
MKHKLISVASIAVLLFIVLGNCIACTTPTTNYTLTMSSTAGGAVTPTIGAHSYSAGTVVNLTATPDSGYRFVNWTGGGTDIGNAIAATTTITMNADHTITAHFALGVLIADVPDANQPPTHTLASTNISDKNFCAPMAMANVLEYWDDVANHANAQNVTAGLIPETVAEYLGWFMDTNNNGSPARFNAGMPGTYNVDIRPGTLEYVEWDDPIAPAPPFAVPAGKLGYNWSVLMDCSTSYNDTLSLYELEVNSGRPLVVSFDYWNPVDKGINYTDPETGETISVYVWGDSDGYHSYPPDPEEYWDPGNIGHAVTGVGYILNWDPDCAGSRDWVIVHDNWATTPENVAIPWANWMCLWHVTP